MGFGGKTRTPQTCSRSSERGNLSSVSWWLIINHTDDLPPWFARNFGDTRRIVANGVPPTTTRWRSVGQMLPPSWTATPSGE
jgi:hypothetical protein